MQSEKMTVETFAKPIADFRLNTHMFPFHPVIYSERLIEWIIIDMGFKLHRGAKPTSVPKVKVEVAHPSTFVFNAATCDEPLNGIHNKNNQKQRINLYISTFSAFLFKWSKVNTIFFDRVQYYRKSSIL